LAVLTFSEALMRIVLLLAAFFALPVAHAAASTRGDVAAGKAAFAACASCHQVGPSARNTFGPQLNGIIGRRAGTDPDFKYSPALRNSQFIWSEKMLAAFIVSPDKVVPGNRMRFLGLGYDEKKLADLLAYLRTLPASN